MSYLIITHNIVIVTSNLKVQLTPVNGFLFFVTGQPDYTMRELRHLKHSC